METEQEEDTQDSDQLISWFDDNAFPTDEFSALRSLPANLDKLAQSRMLIFKAVLRLKIVDEGADDSDQH